MQPALLLCFGFSSVVYLLAGGQQNYHYRQCLLKYGSDHRYMAFIDNDEVHTRR